MKTLSEIFKISKGKKAEEVFINTGLRYIQIGDLRNDDVVKYTNAAASNVLCNKDDILIAWDGANAGTVGYNLEGVIGSTLAKLTPKTKNIHSSYVGRFLQSKFNYLRENCTGATIPHLSRPVLESLQIPLPPLDVQQKIASILDAADTLRQKDKALLAKYDELTQALFLDMFGDPVSNPKGWEKVATIKYCSSIVPGRDKPKSFTGNTPWITTNDLIHLGSTLVSKSKLGLTNEEISEVKSKVIPEDSVIMTCVGELGIISINKVKMVVNQQLHAFICSEKLNNIFLMYNISYQKPYMFKMASSTTVPYMNKTVCNNIPTIVPPIQLQTQFAERVAIIEQQKAQAQASLEKSEELFNSLLQKAFNGELIES